MAGTTSTADSELALTPTPVTALLPLTVTVLVTKVTMSSVVPTVALNIKVQLAPGASTPPVMQVKSAALTSGYLSSTTVTFVSVQFGLQLLTVMA